MHRMLQWILITAFLALTTLPLLLLLVQEPVTVSAIEKRTLASYPRPADYRDRAEVWPQAFREYFNDHFGLREQLVTLYNLVKLKLGISPSSKVVVGEQGWLFFNGGNAIDLSRRNIFPLSDGQLEQWRDSLLAKQAYLEGRGVGYLFVVAPDKDGIYTEHLPYRYRVPYNTPRHDQLFDYLGRTPGLAILDLRPALLAAKDEARVYFRTDTHWNAYGANIAQHEIAQRLAPRIPIEPRRYRVDEFRWEESLGGDLAFMMNMHTRLTEQAPVLEAALPECRTANLRGKDYYPRGRQRAFVTRCPAGNGLRALVFRDSFFSQLESYFSQYFSEVYYLWASPDMTNLERVIDDIRPDVVVEELVERQLNPLPEFMLCRANGPLACPGRQSP